MAVRLRIRGFQSIEDATLVIDKFTVVTGQNNSGKTASFRAAQGVFTNPGGDAFVRHGSDRLKVDLAFDDGQSVSWEKGPKVKPTYTLNGKEILPGRQVPQEVLDLGVQPIQVGSQSIWPQIAPQFTGQVFLLDMPGSALAEAVADVERVSKLTQALRLAESDKRAATSELKVRRKDVDTLNTSLQAYVGLDQVDNLVSDLEASEQQNTDLATQIQTLQHIQSKMKMLGSEIAFLNGMQDIALPPDTTEVRKVQSSLASAKQLGSRLQQAHEQVAKYRHVPEISIDVPDVKEVRQTLMDLKSLRARLVVLKNTTKDADQILGLVETITQSASLDQATKAAKIKSTLSQLIPMNTQMRDLRVRIQEHTRQIAQVQSQHEEAAREVQDLLQEMGVCPVCQSGIAHEHGGAQ